MFKFVNGYLKLSLLKVGFNRLIIGIFLIFILSSAPVYAASHEGPSQGAGTLLAISNISVANITQTSATISWETNGDATSQLFFDTVSHPDIGDYTANITDSANVTLHSISLNGLSLTTTYHYRVRSVMAVPSFIGVSDDYIFTTLSPPAEEPPPSGGGGGTGIDGAFILGPGVVDVAEVVTNTGKFKIGVAIKSADGKVGLIIDEGTFGLIKNGDPITKMTVLEVAGPPVPPADTSIIGLAYDLGPDGATFDPPITLTFTYELKDIPEGVDGEDLVIAIWDEDSGEWVVLEGATVDLVTRTISVPVSHFTAFAIIGTVIPEPEELVVEPEEPVVEPEEPVVEPEEPVVEPEEPVVEPEEPVADPEEPVVEPEEPVVEPEEPVAAPEEPEEPAEGISWWIWGVIAVVVVAVAAGSFMWWRRRLG